MSEFTTPGPLLGMIALAPDADALATLRIAHPRQWSDQHSLVAQARLDALARERRDSGRRAAINAAKRAAAERLTRAARARRGPDFGARARREADRAAAIALYGGRCVSCGFDDPRFLEFDHIDDNGGEHRAIEGGATWCARMAKRATPDDRWRIQLLCIPCHRGPGRPGKTGRRLT
jgi:hypothetical protein